VAQLTQYAVVESTGLFQVVGADCNVGEYANLLSLQGKTGRFGLVPSGRVSPTAIVALFDSAIEMNDGTDALAFVHQVEGLVDVL
jgi:hypothetical protein